MGTSMIKHLSLVSFTAFEFKGGVRITLLGKWYDGSALHVDHFTLDPGFSWGLFTICGYAYL